MRKLCCQPKPPTVEELRHKQIVKLLNKIMSAITDYAKKQTAFNDRQALAIDSLVESQTGLSGDLAELNRLIKELQESPGEVTPEDLETINKLEAAGEAAATRAEGVAAALKALDEQHPPVVPTPPTP